MTSNPINLARVVAVLLLSSACSSGPQIRKVDALQWEPWDAKEYRQEKSGVVVELTEQEVPVVKMRLVKCDENGDPLYNVVVDKQGNSQRGSPQEQDVNLADFSDGIWRVVTITNNTTKVIRMNEVSIRLKDNHGNLLEPTYGEQLKDSFGRMYGCNSVGKIATAADRLMQKTPLLTRNAEITPGETKKSWTFFTVSDESQMPGVWTFRVFNVPVELDQAGRPTRTENFELRSKLRKFKEVYADGKLKSRKELDQNGEVGEETVPQPKKVGAKAAVEEEDDEKEEPKKVSKKKKKKSST